MGLGGKMEGLVLGVLMEMTVRNPFKYMSLGPGG